jgi:predicted secreted protein
MRHNIVQCMADAVAQMPQDQVDVRYGASKDHGRPTARRQGR